MLGLLALALRVTTVWVLWADHREALTFEHGAIAENLLAGRGFAIPFLGGDGPTSQQTPFYPLLLAAVYACFGTGTHASLLAVEILQCLAGTGLVLAVVWLAWSLVPQRPAVGWLAGLAAAVYPTHLYMVTHLQVAVWAALVLTGLLAVVASPRWRGTTGGACLAGGLAGLLLLIEPILALALPVCAVVFWLDAGNWRQWFALRSLARAGLMPLVAALVIAPWMVRNYRVHGEFFFIKSTFGYAFWQGNNPISWGTDKVPKPTSEALRTQHDGTLAGMNRALWEARHENFYIDSLLLKPADYERLGRLSEPERCRTLGREAWQFVTEHPGRYAQLCLQRLRYFFLFDETNPKAANLLYRWSTIVWLVLGFVGLIGSWRHWRAFWPTYLILAAVALFHALVIVSVRFRIPVEPLGMLWAAAALAPLLDHFRRRPQIRVWRPGERADSPLEHSHVLKGPHWKPHVRRRAA